MGGREAFVSATLPGHLDAVHRQRKGYGLTYKKPRQLKTAPGPKQEKPDPKQERK